MSAFVSPAYHPALKAVLTPSLASILAAYNHDGHGDRELLLAILDAKRLEDERLAALDRLRAEELRFIAAHTFTQTAHHSNRPQIAPASSSISLPPSPPVSAISTHTIDENYYSDDDHARPKQIKRPRTSTATAACSSSSSASSTSPSHHDVMTALRSKVSSPRRHSLARSRHSPSASPSPPLAAQETRQESRQQTAPPTNSTNNKPQLQQPSPTTTTSNNTKKSKSNPSSTSTDPSEHYTSLAPVSNMRGVKPE